MEMKSTSFTDSIDLLNTRWLQSDYFCYDPNYILIRSSIDTLFSDIGCMNITREEANSKIEEIDRNLNDMLDIYLSAKLEDENLKDPNYCRYKMMLEHVKDDIDNFREFIDEQ